MFFYPPLPPTSTTLPRGGLQGDMGAIGRVCPLPGALQGLRQSTARGGSGADDVMVLEESPGSGSESSLQTIGEAGMRETVNNGMQYHVPLRSAWIDSESTNLYKCALYCTAVFVITVCRTYIPVLAFTHTFPMRPYSYLSL